MSEVNQGGAGAESQSASQSSETGSQAENQSANNQQQSQQIGGDQSGVFEQQEKLYAGKYKSVEDLEKAYGEAQKLIGKKTEPKEKEGVAGIDIADVGKRFQEQRRTGQFDDDVAQVLKDHFGIDPSYVQQAEQSIRSQQRAAAEKELGREVDWDKWNEWFPQNVSKAQQDAALALMSEGDYSLFNNLVTRFEGANQTADDGKIGTTPTGSSGEASERTPFSSQKEIAEAIAKASTNNDHKAWKLIEARLKVTPDRLKTNYQRI